MPTAEVLSEAAPSWMPLVHAGGPAALAAAAAAAAAAPSLASLPAGASFKGSLFTQTGQLLQPSLPQQQATPSPPELEGRRQRRRRRLKVEPPSEEAGAAAAAATATATASAQPAAASAVHVDVAFPSLEPLPGSVVSPVATIVHVAPGSVHGRRVPRLHRAPDGPATSRREAAGKRRLILRSGESAGVLSAALQPSAAAACGVAHGAPAARRAWGEGEGVGQAVAQGAPAPGAVERGVPTWEEADTALFPGGLGEEHGADGAGASSAAAGDGGRWAWAEGGGAVAAPDGAAEGSAAAAAASGAPHAPDLMSAGSAGAW